MKKQILVVDDMATNLQYAIDILGDIYEVVPAKSGERALKILNRIIPDLILLDINMPDMDGYEVLERIKENPVTTAIPVIFLSFEKDKESELKGFRCGAVDFITKPFEPEVMISRINTRIELSGYRQHLKMLVEQKTAVIEELQDIISTSFAELVESRDGTTGGHIRRTAKFFGIFVDELKNREFYKDILTKSYIKELLRAAPLHDIGKIGIEDKILRKASFLEEDEYEYMKSHTLLGGETFEKIIKQLQNKNEDVERELRFVTTAKEMALYHHERWNGTGYPYGLSGEDIPLSARIISIVDVYEALTAKRSYKEPFSHEKAIKIMAKETSTFFDPKLIEIFLEIHEKFID